MAEEDLSPEAQPAAPQDRIPLAPLFFCVAAAPFAWTLLHLTAYPLASYACFPRTAQRLLPLPGWDWVRPAMIGLALAMLGLALAGGWASWRELQRARRIAVAETLSPHEGAGRSRWFAVCGIVTTVLFAGAILADAIMLVGVQSCRD